MTPTFGSKSGVPSDSNHRRAGAHLGLGDGIIGQTKNERKTRKKHEIKQIYTTVQNKRQLLYHKVPMKERKKNC
jgi:hypothetical protein